MHTSIACLILLVLAGCGSVKTYDIKYAQQLSQQQRLNIEQWNMRGRLLIKSDEVLAANLQWQHNKQKDVLKLSGALGLGAMQIEMDAHEIILHDAQGRQYASQDIDAFIARQIGFVVPITALRHWVLGAHLEGVSVVRLENGFQQLGWRITFKAYMDTSAGILPQHIKITKNNIKLKLIIDRWEIE